MKVYSIGREVGCDIVINDNSDVISRRHATLNVSPTGKMTIVDLSHNGTYVNGIRIAQNVPVPVTRKDNVSFAHVARLDWSLVPNTGGMIIKWSIIALVALIVIGGSIWFLNSTPNEPTPNPNANTVQADSLANKKKVEEEEKQKNDSIKKHVQDSLKNAKQKKVPTNENNGKNGKKNGVKDNKKDNKKNEAKDSVQRKRIRG
ncbi:MAG: FHA domain-containing protein [Prevotella sp.]|nr:FHA domain-containing protein [Prevotella sp.]